MKSRNQTQGKYSGTVGQRHSRDWFGWKVNSIGTPRTRKAKKAIAIHIKHNPFIDDIPF